MRILEGKYALAVYGVRLQVIEEAVAGLPVTVRYQPRRRRVLVTYAGDARSVAGYYAGIQAIREARRRIQEAAEREQ
jgi:hypothetical protein